jgi:hypothetical protein
MRLGTTAAAGLAAPPPAAEEAVGEPAADAADTAEAAV